MMHAHDNQMRVYLQRESTHTQTLNKNQGQSLRELAAHDKKKKNATSHQHDDRRFHDTHKQNSSAHPKWTSWYSLNGQNVTK